MKLDEFLHYVTNTANNQSIIQWLLFIIALITTLMMLRLVFGKSETKTAKGDTPFAGTLDKILEETQGIKLHLATAPPVDTSVVRTVADPKVLEQLSLREKEIEDLKVQLKSMPVAVADSGDVSEKLKDLESRLAEYEILEDDIADLSLFKEENARLKAQLDALNNKGSMPALVEIAQDEPFEAEPTEAEAPEDNQTQDDIVAEFQAAVTDATEPTAPPVEIKERIAMISSEDVLAEFSDPETANAMIDETANSAAETGLEIDSSTSKMIEEVAAMAALMDGTSTQGKT